jgi:hypothetical protein
MVTIREIFGFRTSPKTKAEIDEEYKNQRRKQLIEWTKGIEEAEGRVERIKSEGIALAKYLNNANYQKKRLELSFINEGKVDMNGIKSAVASRVIDMDKFASAIKIGEAAPAQKQVSSPSIPKSQGMKVPNGLEIVNLGQK